MKIKVGSELSLSGLSILLIIVLNICCPHKNFIYLINKISNNELKLSHCHIEIKILISLNTTQMIYSLDKVSPFSCPSAFCSSTLHATIMYTHGTHIQFSAGLGVVDVLAIKCIVVYLFYSGIMRAGVNAIMGPSGSGKST